MQWSKETYGGFSQAEPWLPMSAEFREEITVEAQEKDPDSILAFYKKLIAMRKEYSVIGEGEISFLETGTDMVIAYQRALGEQEMLVFCNLDGKEQGIRLDGEWKGYKVMLENYPMPWGEPLPDGDCSSRRSMDCEMSFGDVLPAEGRETLKEISYIMKPYELLVLGKNVIS